MADSLNQLHQLPSMWVILIIFRWYPLYLQIKVAIIETVLSRVEIAERQRWKLVILHFISNQSFTHIHKWSIDWQLAISLSKCDLFELGPHCLQSHPFFLSTTQLPYTDTVKDLGINIGPNLKFCQHIPEIPARANQRSHRIHRCFLSRQIEHLIKAFIVYVRPLLEYASPVWSPSQLYAINAIERVQRSYTKRLQ